MAVQALIQHRDVAQVALQVLNEKARFLQKPENSMTTRKRLYPTYPPWEVFMQDIEKVKLAMSPQKKRWIKYGTGSLPMLHRL